MRLGRRKTRQLGDADTSLGPTGHNSAVSPRFARLTRKVRAILLFERVWRLLLPPLLVLGLFLCVSWMGLWLEIPHSARALGVLGFAIGVIIALLPLARLRWPARREALDRIDRDSGLSSRPAAALADRLANATDDPTTQALWTLYRRRAEEAVRALEAGLPSPRLVDRDPYSLRAAVLVGLVATSFVAGPEIVSRTSAAFDWRSGPESDIGRVDAWIDPPAYTGRAPIMLNVGGDQDLLASTRKIEAPSGSIIIIRAAGRKPTIETRGALEEAPKDTVPKELAAKAADSKSTPETRLVLRGNAKLTLGLAGARLDIFDITAIRDQPPTIALTDVPHVNARGSVTLAYRVQDDYGVASAEASFADPLLESGQPSRRSLVEAPRVALLLPPPADLDGMAETIADLSEHPWAGTRATMTLTARDESGGEGKSLSLETLLPQKPLTKPLARALAEQRRNLVLAPDDKARVATALEALMIAPEAYATSAGVYLGLYTARARLEAARDDRELVEIADYLWAMALRIENGDLSAAERDLRAAEQNLRDALARKAPEDEIRDLVENLRDAMENFLREFASEDQDQRRADELSAPGQGARSIDPKDLRAMLDKMEAMTRSGSLANAQKMLDQLQNILENLRMARPGKANPRASEASRALDELSQMSQAEQDLRDETYQRGQDQRHRERAETPMMGLPGYPFGGDPFEDEDSDNEDPRDTRSGETDQADGPSMTDLAQRQQALRERLDKLQERLRGAGQGETGLDAAQDAMRDAETALNKTPGKGNAAVAAQGRALDALHQGAQKLAEAMQGEGDGRASGMGKSDEGEEGRGGRPQNGRRGGTDPLGRMTGSGALSNAGGRYDPLGVPASERAQRVLEELRRRLGEPARPREEMDYLERLLRRY